MRYRIKINQSKLVLLETVSHPFPRLTHVHTRLYMHLYEILTQEPLGIESGQFLRWYNWFSFHSFKVLIAKFSGNRYEKALFHASIFDLKIGCFFTFFSVELHDTISSMLTTKRCLLQRYTIIGRLSRMAINTVVCHPQYWVCSKSLVFVRENLNAITDADSKQQKPMNDDSDRNIHNYGHIVIYL